MIPQSIQENMASPPTQYENQIDYESKKDESCSGHNGRWGTKEHIMFLGGCLQYGNNWKKVEAFVKTRTSTQIRSHAQKFLKKIEKKYISSQNQNNASYDSVSEELINNNIISQNKENPNKTEENKQEGLSLNENTPEENNQNKESDQMSSLKNDDIVGVDNKTKLSPEVIQKLVEELPKPGFNIEIVEKIILRIFKLNNKKFDDFQKPELNFKKNGQKSNGGISKNNKNIFLCQKLKRDINYDAQIKELLSSNNQDDLRKLFKIFDQEKDSIRYNILMKAINDD